MKKRKKIGWVDLRTMKPLKKPKFSGPPKPAGKVYWAIIYKKYGTICPFDGAIAIFEREQDARYNACFYAEEQPVNVRKVRIEEVK